MRYLQIVAASVRSVQASAKQAFTLEKKDTIY